jgi:hypothetical protein
MDFIPVVTSSAVAARPIIAMVQWGASLEAGVKVLQDGQTAHVNVDSCVSEPREMRQKPVAVRQMAGGKPGGFPPNVLDCLDFDARLLQTSVRVPLGKAVLVGGMVLADPRQSGPAEAGAAKAPAKEKHESMYLVLRVSASKARRAK